MSKIVLSKDDFQAFWEATVRYYELDPQGVMHNANYVAFFDQAILPVFCSIFKIKPSFMKQLFTK